MELLKKLFNFSETISGVNFLIRWIASIVIQYPGGMLVAYGISGGSVGLAMLGLMLASCGIFLQFSTLMKRSRALFTNTYHTVLFYFLYIVLSILNGFARNSDPIIAGTVGIAVLLVFCIALFKNSKIAPVDHKG